MSKQFLLLSDGWKMLIWLTVKIKYYFHPTQTAMCIEKSAHILKKKKKKTNKLETQPKSYRPNKMQFMLLIREHCLKRVFINSKHNFNSRNKLFEKAISFYLFLYKIEFLL